MPSQSEYDELLAPIIRERARFLAPSVLFALVAFLIAAPSLGIAPYPVWHAIAAIPALVMAVVTVAQVRNAVPQRWLHLASTIGFCCPVASTLIGFAVTRDPAFSLLLVLLVATGGVLLHTRYLVTALAAILVLAIPLQASSTGMRVGMQIAALITAALFALLLHVLLRRALLRAELHRIAEVASKDRLSAKIAELERAQSERAALHEQLIHAQRLEAVGTLAAGLAHDMNNVLGSITQFAELALEQIPSSPARADLQQIITQAARGAELTRGLLAFSRRGQYRRRVVRIASVIDDVLPLLRRTLNKSIAIETDVDVGDASVEGDPVHLHQVLINMGLNAADAMDHSGRLTLRARLVVGKPQRVEITVSDTGKGMDAATRLRVFEPFFTTKPQGRGTGLGLAIVWGIVQAHGGSVDVESAVGQGTTFRIMLPLTNRAPSSHAMQRLAPNVGVHATVLVVEDEPAVRAGMQRMLERMGLRVLTADDGEQGLRVFEQHARDISLVILDMGMPVMGGAECFRKLRERSDVPVVIATGYACDAEAQELVAAGAELIEKPYRAAVLQEAVGRLLAQPAA